MKELRFHAEDFGKRRFPERALYAYIGGIALIVLLGLGCGTQHSQSTAASSVLPTSPVFASVSTSVPATRDVIVSGELTLQVPLVTELSAQLRNRVEEAGGVVELDKTEEPDQKTFRLRIVPNSLQPLLDWLESQGRVTAKTVKKQDVSKVLFDHTLALDSARQTLARMQQILQTPDLDIDAVLKIEKESTRVRTEIAEIEGALRYFKRRVSMATLVVHLKKEKEHSLEKVRIGVRLLNMRLLAPRDRSANRGGIGVVMKIPLAERVFYALDVFEPVDGDKRAFTLSAGGASYSELLGGGRRTFLNPYLGGRIGYGRFEGHNVVLAGEMGVSVVRNTYMSLDVNVQATGFLGKEGPHVALISAVEASLAF